MNRKHEDLYTIHTKQKLKVIFGIIFTGVTYVRNFFVTNRTIHITIIITVKLLRKSIVVEYNLFFVVYLTAFGISFISTHHVT